MDTDVIIVGAGPAGLMLAAELCLAGVRPLVLERQPRLRETPKANGFNGQIVELLRYRGLLDRVEAASGRPIRPAPAAPFLVGCDGAHSRVRDSAGIPFPGTTYPEVNRLAQATVPDSVTRLENGDLDVPGLGRIRAGFTRTDRGVFGFGWLNSGALLVQTTEDEIGNADDDASMTLTEFQDSIRRVLGGDLPLREVTRLSRYVFQARQAERYRDGRILLAGDAAHQFPATGIGINFGMLDAVNLLADEQPLRRMGALIAGADLRYPMPGSSPSQHAWTGTLAPDLTLRTDQGTTSVARLMHAARPIFLDLAGRADLCATARDWGHRTDIRTAETDDPPADALLIRPDAHIAWAATVAEPASSAAVTLRQALSYWFGTPLSGTS